MKVVPFVIIYHFAKFGEFWTQGIPHFVFLNSGFFYLHWKSIGILGKVLNGLSPLNGAARCCTDPAHPGNLSIVRGARLSASVPMSPMPTVAIVRTWTVLKPQPTAPRD
jgi:hypothetical protein